MGHQPFSVALSVYKNDDPVYFNRALESITHNQTIKPDEIVLVVDGSVSDEINAVIEQYSNGNFKVIRLETNRGLGNALRIATESCSFELIARMDSDDVAAPDRFEQQLQFLKANPDVDILGGNISEFIKDESNVVSYRIVPTCDKEIKSYIKKRCPFNHMTVMFKKSSIMNAGGYLDWHYNEDYYLWIRMFLNNCVFANIPSVLVNVRTGKEQFGRRGGLRYYKNEKALQRYMLDNGIIGRSTFICNCFKRLVVQVLMPNRIRTLFYLKIIRRK